MFSDPEPRPILNQRKRHSSGGGFFSSSRPLDDPRNVRNKYARKPLEERSPSQINQQSPRTVPSSPPKTTVRIVNESPTILGTDNSDHFEEPSVDKNTGEKVTDEHDLSPVPSLPENAGANPLKGRGLPGLLGPASDLDTKPDTRHVSSTKEAQQSGTDHTNVLPAVSRFHASENAASHRRSGSSGNFSTSSTLKEGDSSFFGGQSVGSRSRLSQGTTLRGTPAPYEEDEEAARSGPTQALQTLEEASPERSTVRTVPASSSSASSPLQLQSEATPSSPIVRRYTKRSSNSEAITESPGTRSSRRTSSTGSSLPTAANLRDVSVIYYPQTQRSQDSLAQSDTSLPAASSPNFAVFPSEQTILPSSVPPSSPNFVAYYSDSSRPRSRSHPLHGTTSHESIASRLQPQSRPQTGSAASPGPSSSTDTLPPLQLPKKRLRHKPAALSLDSSSNRSFTQGNKMVTEEELDTLPYPRYQYSNPLSTILSESDRQSRTSSQPLSHFSLGSGVLTGDDSSSIPLSGNWSMRRRGSAPIESMVSSSPGPGTSSGEREDAGDMTLGLFREESAKPQPLFKTSGSLPGQEDRKYDGPLPPIPPIPPSRESDENFDTVSELQSPPLREQRSGYSLRARSNSTPSRSQSRRSNSHSRHLSQVSYVESDRGSHGSSIFPVWAKQFYKHNVPLMSASKVSLGGYNPPPARPGQSHLRNDSQWTERSITSRLGTGYSEIESASPTSSHFLPSIFRPRTRGRSKSGGKKLQKGKGRPSQDSRPDSMGIYPDPVPHDSSAETTEAGQPKYGELKDSHEQRRPLPRKYSKQKQWNEMTFPRPMTKDRLSDFGMHMNEPHLGPSKRISNRLSVWRAPSFVESLDSLVRSRTNRQILLFALGFVLPFCWMVAAVLPLPKQPVTADQLEKSLGGSEDDVAAAMMKHEAGDAEKRWKDEKMYLKARWWRSLNRIMSVVGLLVIGAVIALAVVATTR